MTSLRKGGCVARAAEVGRAARLGGGLASGALVGLVMLELDLPGVASFWGDQSLLAPAAAVLGALVGLTRLRRLVLATAMAFVGLWLAASYTPLVPWMAEGLVRRDAPQQA